jgi:hypothetical protein
MNDKPDKANDFAFTEREKLSERIIELECRLASIERGFNNERLTIKTNPERLKPLSYSWNLLGAAIFPLISGAIRAVYDFSYRFTKK